MPMEKITKLGRLSRKMLYKVLGALYQQYPEKQE